MLMKGDIGRPSRLLLASGCSVAEDELVLHTVVVGGIDLSLIHI